MSNLDEITANIAKDNPLAADRFVRKLYATVLSLDQTSLRGRIVPELNDPDLHELLYGDYRVLYRVEQEAVLIVSIVHGARDLKTLWPRSL